MIAANALRKGTVIEMDGELFRCLDYQHSYIGRGSANVKVRLRNLRSGATVDRTLPPAARLQDVRLEGREVQYLYNDGDFHYFMDTETYEQPVLSAQTLGDAVQFLKDNQILKIAFHEEEAIEVELPTTVDLAVTYAEPGVKGDTATGATKSVTTETGLKVQVPLFVNEGDVIRVDTRSGEYLTRV